MPKIIAFSNDLLGGKQTLTGPDALAVGLCARSEQHSAGAGIHDAARWGACSLHEQMAAETWPLTGNDLIVRIEWGVRLSGRTHHMYTDEEAARRFAAAEAEDGAVVVHRATMEARENGILLDGHWIEETA